MLSPLFSAKMLLPIYVMTAFLAFVPGGLGQQSPISPDTPVSSLVASAKSYLSNGSPRDALVYLDAAITRDPTNYLTVFQRGAAYLSLGRRSQAQDDFDRVLQLKPDFESALLQRARLKSNTADWPGALNDLEKAGKKDSPEYKEFLAARDAATRALDAEKKGQWETCISEASTAIAKASASLNLRQSRAHCRFEQGELEEGISDLVHSLAISPGKIDPHLQISSMLFFTLSDSERGLSQIRKCLHSDPDSKPCNKLYKREKQLDKRLRKLQDAVAARKFNNALNLLVGVDGEAGLLEDVKGDVQHGIEAGHIFSKSEGLLYASLVERTCEAFNEVHMPKRASGYCTEALGMNPHSLPALLFKSQVALDEDRFDDAIRDLNTAKEHHPQSKEIQSLLQKATVLQKRAKQKDYYKVLGVARDADERTIKRAYRQLTKQHHPDKAHSQGVTKEDAEKKMAGINEAYEVLSDPELRTQYDNGVDPNDPESQRSNPFPGGSPFGGGGPQFFFQQGGPQFKFQSGGGFNFPGGFPF
ncbi:DnaJ and TPR domain protein [Aspergillus stella-maris]|uniref:DnaJ and TPR domain protein n=1 Tax=Aspergillus stella-maris TaxID=1810926 RepID=UPI003CCCEC9F